MTDIKDMNKSISTKVTGEKKLNRVEKQYGRQLDLSGIDLLEAIEEAETKKHLDCLRMACVKEKSQKVLERWQERYREMCASYTYSDLQKSNLEGYNQGIEEIEKRILDKGKCPSCIAGIFPHRNCIMR